MTAHTRERTTLAAVVIATDRRVALLDRILDSIQDCDECVIVGNWPANTSRVDYRYYQVPGITHTTLDALMRRDVGWIVTDADAVLFLSDDHRLDPGFVPAYHAHYATDQSWDFLGPTRYTVRDGQRIWLNNGRDEQYIGGHGGIYRRRCARALPWMTAPHHPNWDLLHAHLLQQQGLRLRHADRDVAIEDIEPGAQPWK
jgi:hypothetical protein